MYSYCTLHFKQYNHLLSRHKHNNDNNGKILPLIASITNGTLLEVYVRDLVAIHADSAGRLSADSVGG